MVKKANFTIFEDKGLQQTYISFRPVDPNADPLLILGECIRDLDADTILINVGPLFHHTPKVGDLVLEVKAEETSDKVIIETAKELIKEQIANWIYDKDLVRWWQWYKGEEEEMCLAPFMPRKFMPLSDEQIHTLAWVGRCSSTLSILGVMTILGTFSCSKHFRNPMHRLIFINAFFNLFDFIATMISVSGPEAGDHSALCQFQGFSLQMFPLADVLWTLAMAVDVFLMVFYSYDAQALRSLEIKYLTVITIVVFVPAVAFLFVNTPGKGPMYGSVTIWCAISPPWVLFRIVFYYVPIWLSILVIVVLYTLVGIEVSKLRRKLTSPGSNHIALSSLSSLPPDNPSDAPTTESHPITKQPTITHQFYPQQRPVSFRQYILMPLVFFLVLLATWVAPTINRISAFKKPDHGSYSLLLAVVAMGSLRGFWNGVVFISIGMKGWRGRKGGDLGHDKRGCNVG